MSLTIAIIALTLGKQSNNISSYWQAGLKDAAFTAVVEKAQQRELTKINKDFASSYRFKSTNVWMKEPFKLRLEAKIEDQDIYFILNGTRRLLRVPKSGISQREDLAKSPGKRQTALDFGVVTPGLFNDLFEAKFIRIDKSTGQGVFDLTYLAKFDDGTRNRVWIDPSKKYVVKREWYSQYKGYLMATFTYDQPAKSAGGVNVPTHLSVSNADGKFAGSTSYRNMRINEGIPESLFETK